jgi:sulfur carrier protein
MRIVLNGNSREVMESMLDRALTELGYGGSIVATAINGEFVAASTRPTVELREGDRVEVLAPMQGG